MGRRAVRSNTFFVFDSHGQPIWRNSFEDHLLYKFTFEGKQGFSLKEREKEIARWLQDDFLVLKKDNLVASTVSHYITCLRIDEPNHSKSSVVIFESEDVSITEAEAKFVLATRGL